MASANVCKAAAGGVWPRVVRLILLAAFFASAQGVVRVASFDDLRRIGRDGGHPLSADYELVCDIDASDSRVRPFEPIGGGGSPFTGRFYGRGGAVYVIRNLYISKPSAGHVGLFGVVGYGAEVSNVGVAADTVSGSFAVGILAGSSNGRIVNCYGTGVVAAGRRESDAGGLVGVNGGGIYGSWSAADVYGADNVGGLVGLLRISTVGEVRQCFALGAVRGGDNVGGLVGQVFGGRVRESFSAGRVTGGVAGGLIGRDFASALAWSDRGVFEADGETYYVGAAEVSASFWDTEASGRRASAGGTGRDGALMRRRETFAGWDFDSVWAVEEGLGYPQLLRTPYRTRTLAYSTDGEGCGRLKIRVAGGVAERYVYRIAVASGADGPEVTAEAWDGCRFTGWSDGAKGARRTDAALRDTAVAAKFEPLGGWQTRRYSYEAAAGGGLRASGVSGTAAAVDTAIAGPGGVAVAASPGNGRRFAGWSDGVEGVVRADGPWAVSATALFREIGGKPIVISRYEDLRLIGRYAAYYPLDGNYELACDIEILTNERLQPIGSKDAPFTGTFAGNGCAISGLDIDGGDFAGLFGYTDGADIRGLFLEGRVAGGDNVGMLAGMCVNTVIDSCGVRGSARGRSGVGGLVGRSAGSLISRVYSAASVEGLNEVGGLAGGSRGSFLAQSCASGSVSGSAYAGGAVGWGAGGYAQDCCAAGSAAGEWGVGGFIGRAGGGIGVSRSYSAGSVAGGVAASGGFAGTLGGGDDGAAGGAVSMTGCYWDAERSGSGASVGGVGMGTEAMRRKETYAGWDFEGVWEIDGGYPRLRGLAQDSVPGFSFEQRRPPAAAPASVKPLARAAGRAVYVNARPGERVRIRLIDMRGKTVAKYETAGAKKLLIDNVPSGVYIVEAGRRGRREFAAPIRIVE